MVGSDALQADASGENLSILRKMPLHDNEI